MADEYLNQLYKAWDDSFKEFNKKLTFVSSGIFAVSYAFIDKVVELPKAKEKGTLVFGWELVGIAIFITLLGFAFDVLFNWFAISYYAPKDDARQRRVRHASAWTAFLISVASLVLLVIGSLNIISFIKQNI